MNWINELNSIYSKLENSGHADVKAKLVEAQQMGGTGGEIFLLVADELKKIKTIDPLVFSIIESEVTNILSYGEEIGYL